jgi:predicted transcriptional regulator
MLLPNAGSVSELYGVTPQKALLFIVTAVITSPQIQFCVSIIKTNILMLFRKQ